MGDYIIPIRWIHVIAGSAWFGEVIVINFILIPVLGRLDMQSRRAFLANVFPRVFRVASVLSATTVIAGFALLWHYTGGNLARLLHSGRWGIAILVGGSLGTLLTLFHFFMENRMAKKIGLGPCGPADDAVVDIHAKLKVVPRLGLLVISSIFFSMMYAVRGL
ncbi:MAG: hypothetical protein KC503_01330 [Myxococcales bacterium]|nr:hypothetical protein [Myxococcales bacterium]